MKDELIREAQFWTALRRHTMFEFQQINQSVYRSSCELCGMEVDVNLKPLPNDVHIGGEAVALVCPAMTPVEPATRDFWTIFT